jgi:hypothetical protein
MPYEVRPITSFPQTDPIWANPNAGAWVIYETTDGYIADSCKSLTAAEAKCNRWNEDTSENE